MQHLAKVLDEVLEAYAGERYGFLLYVLPLGRNGYGTYVTNAQTDDVASLIEKLLARLKANLPTPPVHRIKLLS